jgi:hypothetical protein
VRMRARTNVYELGFRMIARRGHCAAIKFTGPRHVPLAAYD